MALPSGLPEHVADSEPISRFLTASGHFNTTAVKPAAFMPNPKDGRLSVARHGGDPIEESERIAREDFNLPKVYGVGVVVASAFREEGLNFDADDEPPRHADVIGWPCSESDPEFAKSQQKEKAIVLAHKATRILYP